MAKRHIQIEIVNKAGVKEKVWVEREYKAKCKTCNKNERRDGSAYCEECADKYKKENPDWENQKGIVFESVEGIQCMDKIERGHLQR